MKFINGSMMPWLDEFVDNPEPGHFSWMEEFFETPSADRSVIDPERHRAVFSTIPSSVKYCMPGHEVGTAAGREAYDLVREPVTALSLFIQVLQIARGERSDIQYGFYNLLQAEAHDDAAMDVLDELAHWVDFFAPNAYLRQKSMPEFAARLKLRVAWLKQRWPKKPVYLTAWHKIGYGHWNGQYMPPSTMYAYIEALRDSGADGVFWWAGSSEGITAPDGEGTTNAALRVKHWNHPDRYNNWRADWAEVLKQYTWS